MPHTAWKPCASLRNRPSIPTWVILSGNPAATKHLGLRKLPTQFSFENEEEDLRWIQYVILLLLLLSGGEDGDSWGTPDSGSTLKSSVQSLI
jgi:hypothetical protein